jgi:putative ABC transport system substrate-binding protein
MANVTNPVALGLVASLARPGGNITGITNLAPELGEKRLELLKAIVPKLSRVAVLGDPTSPSHAPGWRETEIAARSLGLQVKSVEVRAPNPDFAGAFLAITKYRADALLTLSQPFIRVNQKQIVEFTKKQRMPAIFHDFSFVEAGGLMSYAADVIELYRRAATYVDKILKGAKPADLPIERPIKFDLAINLKAAKAQGISFQPSILLRATKVIE